VPCRVLGIVNPWSGFGISSNSRIRHSIRRTRERPIDEPRQEVASKDRDGLCFPKEVVVDRKADGDQRGKVERPGG
jgi:hypothetical protein